MNQIGREISKAIKENKWLKIAYRNTSNQVTYYWIYIMNINPRERKLYTSLFNDNISLDAKLTSWIYFDSILDAEVINLTCGRNNEKLIQKIESNPSAYDFLEYDEYSINTLYYLKKCYISDNDPNLKNLDMIPGIDLEQLREKRSFSLNEEQEKYIINLIKKEELKPKSGFDVNLCISALSIDKNHRVYVVCYYDVRFNPATKKLYLDSKLRVNHSFFCEGTKSSIYDYLDIKVEDFVDLLKNDFEAAKKYLLERLFKGELLSTRPIMYLQEIHYYLQFGDLFHQIEDDYKKGKLTPPLKSFFGLMNASSYVRHKEPKICLVDRRINIDQMRVLYNALKYPVTYVQGPPGTGKTKTIINVLFSLLLDDKTALVSSSNNKPVDSIASQLAFTYQNKKYRLPFLRLGNYEDTLKAIAKIRAIFEEIDAKPDLYSRKSINKETSFDFDSMMESNKTLLEKIKMHERKLQLSEVYQNIFKILNRMESRNLAYFRLEEKARAYKEEEDSLPLMSNEEISHLYSSVSSSPKLQEFFYQKRLACFSALNDSSFHRLRSIVFQEEQDAYSDFQKYINEDRNLSRLLKVFPIILDTNISSSRLGTGKSLFDLVIMDESGQCNITTALFPISRGRNLLLVGDPNQLKPVILLNKDVNEQFKKEFHVSDYYDYCKNSILDCMRNNDKVSKYILLRYHYRCGRKIINFSNRRYYHSSLLTNFVNSDGELIYINPKNTNILERNACYEEAKGIVEYAKRNELKDTMIITPFVNQKNLIQDLLDKNQLSDSVSVGTIHSLQGSEKSTIIFSMAISPKTSQKTYEWLKNNSEVINVGITRAKQKLILACDEDAIKRLSKKDDDLYYLVQYVKKKGSSTFIIPPSPLVEFGKSNGSYYEDEFYKTISQFCSVNRNFKAKRNVPVRQLLDNDEKLKYSKQEFDCVLYKTKLFRNIPAIAIEINGGEHFGDSEKEQYDKRKRELCQNAGLTLISIPNSFVKAYEEIKAVILQIAKNNNNFEQLTLFD